MKLAERFKAALATWVSCAPSKLDIAQNDLSVANNELESVRAELEKLKNTHLSKILQLTTKALRAEKERDAIQQEHGRISDVLAEALQELDSVSAEYAHFKVAFKSLTKGYPLLVVLPPHVPLMAGDYYVDGGRLHPLDPYLVGQMAGPFALFIRKLQ